MPRAIGTLMRIALDDDYDVVVESLRAEGFIKPRINVDPEELREYLAPFIEPARVESFRFSRAWMREQFNRLQDPHEPGYTMSLKLNLPPSYLLIHRVWLGGVGVMCQLEAEAPFLLRYVAEIVAGNRERIEGDE